MSTLTQRGCALACLLLAVYTILLPAIAVAQPSVGVYQALPPMSRVASSASAVKLLDGRALVVGFDQYGHVFDPATGTFTETGLMAVAHPGAKLALLPNGKVLIASGASNLTDRRAELYDPSTNTWTLTGEVATGRRFAAVLTAADGRVYLLGGEGVGGVALSSVERYTPATGAFTPAGSLTVPRARAAAVVLADGRFLIPGGMTTGNALVSTAETYNPTTATAAATGSMGFAHASGAAVRLPDGRVLISGGTAHIGGSSFRVTPEAEIYSPGISTFSGIWPMSISRQGHTLTLLPSGKVLVTGGIDDHNVCTQLSEVYDPGLTPPQFYDGPRQPDKYCHHAAVTLDEGTTLFAGGTGVPIPSGGFESSALAMRFDPRVIFADGMGEIRGM